MIVGSYLYDWLLREALRCSVENIHVDQRIARVLLGLSWSVVEAGGLDEKNGILSDTAADYILPHADWVFITASSIANKTLPHLLSLTKNARVVLMGPSLPWSFEWAEFGVSYLAGVDVCDRGKLVEIASEGGGTRISFISRSAAALCALGCVADLSGGDCRL